MAKFSNSLATKNNMNISTRYDNVWELTERGSPDSGISYLWFYFGHMTTVLLSWQRHVDASGLLRTYLTVLRYMDHIASGLVEARWGKIRGSKGEVKDFYVGCLFQSLNLLQVNLEVSSPCFCFIIISSLHSNKNHKQSRLILTRHVLSKLSSFHSNRLQSHRA